MGKQITLTFDISNNFDPISRKYGVEGEDIEIIKTATWFINCAESAIENVYSIGSPRHTEMKQLANSLREQLISQITKDEAEEVKLI